MILFGVNSHVTIKVLMLCETHSTLLAGERFLSSVNSHVIFFSPPCREKLG